MKRDAKYIYVTIKDVNPDINDEYVEWMTEEHIPDLLKVPGVNRGVRYVSEDGSSPMHMMIYELERPEIQKSEAWNKAAKTERSKYMKANWENKAQNVFKLAGVMEGK